MIVFLRIVMILVFHLIILFVFSIRFGVDLGRIVGLGGLQKYNHKSVSNFTWKEVTQES